MVYAELGAYLRKWTEISSLVLCDGLVGSEEKRGGPLAPALGGPKLSGGSSAPFLSLLAVGWEGLVWVY